MKKWIAGLTLAAVISIPALIAGGDCCNTAKDQATAKNQAACTEQAKAGCPLQGSCTEQAKANCPIKAACSEQAKAGCPALAKGTSPKGAERQKTALNAPKAQIQGDIAKK
jgi:hypothetical protein